tara:strand:+ start:1427 stop:2152 length:726 start_codon:yes stop_codon:yes gene_type:complete
MSNSNIYNGRVDIDSSQSANYKYDLYQTNQFMGHQHNGTFLSGWACNAPQQTFDTLEKAEKECLKQKCCGGITLQNKTEYTLRNSRTPLPSPTNEISWIKQNSHSRIPKDGHDNQLQSIQKSSCLSNAFFSDKNQEIIQNSIRYRVWERTQYTIDKQDYLQLQIIMRSIFLQCAKHQSDYIAKQVQELNHRVLEYCVPIITSNLLQFIQYKKDVSSLPVPLEHAMNVSNSGSKSLQTNPHI